MQLGLGSRAARDLRVRAERWTGSIGAARKLYAVRYLALATALLVLGLLAPARAQEEPITFSVIADVPYAPDELEDLLEHIDDHNRERRPETQHPEHVGSAKVT